MVANPKDAKVSPDTTSLKRAKASLHQSTCKNLKQILIKQLAVYELWEAARVVRRPMETVVKLMDVRQSGSEQW